MQFPSMHELVRWKQEFLDRTDCPYCHTEPTIHVTTSHGEALTCKCGAVVDVWTLRNYPAHAAGSTNGL